MGRGMRIAVGSDERTELTEAVIVYVREQGHEVQLYGALAPAADATDWPVVSATVAGAVAQGRAEEGIVLCWTGTGACLAANKVPGIRAALCQDAETARGARVWNHANVLALSLRATSVPIAREILAAWFGTPWSDDEWNRLQIERIADLETGHELGADAG